jgi:hypothetical protein
MTDRLKHRESPAQLLIGSLKLLDSFSTLTGVSRPSATAPIEQSDSRLAMRIVWVLIAVLVALSCGALYALWSQANG